MTDVKKITGKIFVRGKLTALTGLHIGGNSVGMAIGGADVTSEYALSAANWRAGRWLCERV